MNDLETKLTGSIEKLSESVVIVRSTRVAGGFPFGAVPVRGSGSGFIIDPKGYVVTNYHVIDGAKDVEVVLKDGRTYGGKVIGGDRQTDVVLVKIDGNGLPAAKLGDSEKLKVGQFALAIGNALDMPGGPTASLGVISAIARPLPWADFIFEGLIQTDAAINPGNSGGPLADSDGNVIGMNTAIVPFAQGVGFAIPVNTIKWVIEQITEKGRVVRPMLGISAVAINKMIASQFNLKATSGVLVGEVSQNSPASKAGLHNGDIVEEIGGYQVKNIKDLLVALSKLPINKAISIKFIRTGKRYTATVKLEEGPIAN